jgi:hypothetical protein
MVSIDPLVTFFVVVLGGAILKALHGQKTSDAPAKDLAGELSVLIGEIDQLRKAQEETHLQTIENAKFLTTLVESQQATGQGVSFIVNYIRQSEANNRQPQAQ